MVNLDRFARRCKSAGRALVDMLLPQQCPICAGIVGPEGGLSPTETELAAGKGFVAVRLGPRVLRTETAALAALAAIQFRWGDF